MSRLFELPSSGSGGLAAVNQANNLTLTSQTQQSLRPWVVSPLAKWEIERYTTSTLTHFILQQTGVCLNKRYTHILRMCYIFLTYTLQSYLSACPGPWCNKQVPPVQWSLCPALVQMCFNGPPGPHRPRVSLSGQGFYDYSASEALLHQSTE